MALGFVSEQKVDAGNAHGAGFRIMLTLVSMHGRTFRLVAPIWIQVSVR